MAAQRDQTQANRNIILGLLALGLASLLIITWVQTRKTTDPDELSTSTPLRFNDKPVVKVNETYIYESDVYNQARLDNLVVEGVTLSKNDPGFEQTVEKLVDQRLMALSALEQALDQKESSKRRLAQSRERILSNILAEEHVRQTVNDETVRQMYDAQSELRNRGPEVRARHIVVSDEASANNIIARLEDGEAFAALANAYSLDRVSRDNGGDLGYFSQDMLDVKLTQMAFETATGDQVGPFETDLGWHVLEVLDRRQSTSPKFEDMRDEITKFMTYDEIEILLARLRYLANIQRLDDDPQTQSLDPNE